MHAEEHLRAEVVRVSHALHARGWVANHDGNITARLEHGVLATPTATSKAAVTEASLIVVDEHGAVLSGTRKSFSEVKLHLAAYRLRADVGAVVHAHPPSATAFAAACQPLPKPFLAEPVVSLGPEIPLVPFGMPGEPALDDALAAALGRAHAILLGNHGVLVVGPDPDLCLLRLELVEHIARIALEAQVLGGPRPLPEARVRDLADKHRSLFPIDGPMPEHTWSQEAQASPTGGSASSIVQDALRRLGS